MSHGDVMRKRAVVKQIIDDPCRSGMSRPMMTSDPEGDTTWLADQILGQSLYCLHTGLTRSPSEGWCGECQSRYQAVYGLDGGSLMCLVPSHDTTLQFDSPDLIPMHRSWIDFQRAAENNVWHNPTHQRRKGDGVCCMAVTSHLSGLCLHSLNVQQSPEWTSAKTQIY